MSYAFISYSTKNQVPADSLRDLLNQNGIETWMAPGDIPVGSKYAEVINRALKECSCLVLILSNDAQNSTWVSKEVERAVNYRKPVFPVQIEDVVLNDEFELYISTDQIVAVPRIDQNLDEMKHLLSSITGLISGTGPIPNQNKKQAGRSNTLPQNEIELYTFDTCPKESVKSNGSAYGIQWKLTKSGAMFIKPKLRLLQREAPLDIAAFFRVKDSVKYVRVEQGFSIIGGIGTGKLEKNRVRVKFDFGVGFFDFTKLERVILPEGIKAIYDNAFFRCRNLATINIPQTVRYVGAYAFGGCEKLKDLNIRTHAFVDKNAFSEKGGERAFIEEMANTWTSSDIKYYKHHDINHGENKDIKLNSDQVNKLVALDNRSGFFAYTADMLRKDGDLDLALPLYKESVEIRMELVRTCPKGVHSLFLTYVEKLPQLFQRIAHVQEKQGKTEEALEAYQQGIRIQRMLLEKEPSRFLDDTLPNLLHNAANLKVKSDQYDEALEYYREGLNVLRQCAQEKGNFGYYRDKLIDYLNDAATAIESVEGVGVEKAVSLRRESLVIAEEKVNGAAQYAPDDIVTLAQCYYNLGVSTQKMWWFQSAEKTAKMRPDLPGCKKLLEIVSTKL